MSDRGIEETDGVVSKEIVLEQLGSALQILAEHAPARVVTLGGDCGVSVAPFSYLADRYGEDLAIIWLDSHADVGTSANAYRGYHAMAVSMLTGFGDAGIVGQLAASVPPQRVALTGLHRASEDDLPNIAEWGIPTFSPDDLRDDSARLLAWLADTGCSRVAVHIDVDVIDADEMFLGAAPESGGLTSAQVRRVVADLAGDADIVGLTIAEYVPRQVLQLRRFLDGLPLLDTIAN